MGKLKIRPIHDEREHRKALALIERLWEAKPGSDEHDALEVLVVLVEAYEATAFPIGEPDPVEAIRFRMEQLGLDQAGLAELLGSRSRASEVLRGKRKLSLGQIRILHDRLGIPYEALIPGAAA